HTLAEDQDGLIFKPRISRKEVALTSLFRRGQALVIEQRSEAYPKDIPSWQPGQIGSGYSILRIDPVGNSGVAANIVLQPTIGVGDFLAEIYVGYIYLNCLWI